MYGPHFSSHNIKKKKRAREKRSDGGKKEVREEGRVRGREERWGEEGRM